MDEFESFSLDGYGEQAVEKLKSFARLVREENEVLNLTAPCDEKTMWIKHIEDSLAGERFIPEGARCLDVGSGGGFPAIPLAIVRGDIDYTLMDSTGKKCEFLKKAASELGINVCVVTARAEEVGFGDMREAFDVVTARAVARLNTLCEYCMPFVKVGGLFIAYKGRDESEIAEAANAISVLGGKIENTERFKLEQEAGERCIILIRKSSHTPISYPRGKGKERKKPL